MFNLTKQNIESLIYVIRKQKVMLDFDLAKIYGYKTARFNEQIKNNIQKFDSLNRFKLTKSEWNEILLSKKSISSWGGRRITPYAFTETGIYMLMTVLKGELAIKQTKMLIKTFKGMKDYIIENRDLLNPYVINNLSDIVNENTKRIDKVEKKLNVVLTNFVNENYVKHYLILNGEKLEADIAYQTIYSSAKYSIFVIDDYIDIKTLQLLKSAKENTKIIIFSDNKAKNNLNQNYLADFKNDTGKNIIFKKCNGLFHDRYVIIDHNKKCEKIYHCGASSKDAGNKITTISIIEDKELYKPILDKILLNDFQIIK